MYIRLRLFVLAVALHVCCEAAPYAEEDEECGEFSLRKLTIDSAGQTLKSPGFDDGAFSAGQTCFWELHPTGSEEYVQINITDIDIPQDHRCDQSFVEINYAMSVGPYLRFCGNAAREVIVLPFAQSPTITFFASRLSFDGRGFKAEIKSVPKALTCADDEVQCTFPPKCISQSLKCNGAADCNDGNDELGCTANTKEILEPKDVCGKPAIQPDSGDGDRIVGGDEARPHSWPWQISLQGNYVFPSGHSCGGTLINSQWVVTAGHCMAGAFWRVFRIKLGAHNLFQKEDETVTRYISLVFLHPEYNRFTSENDIALIKLSAPVKFTSYIAPACLPDYFPKKEFADGTRLTATGWGETLVRGLDDRLRQASVPVVTLDKCKEQLKEIKDVPEKSICTGFESGGINPCFGDSGGPLVSKTTVGNETRYILQGVVSFGPPICGQAASPTVFSKVAEYGSWIKETMEENL